MTVLKSLDFESGVAADCYDSAIEIVDLHISFSTDPVLAGTKSLLFGAKESSGTFADEVWARLELGTTPERVYIRTLYRQTDLPTQISGVGDTVWLRNGTTVSEPARCWGLSQIHQTDQKFYLHLFFPTATEPYNDSPIAASTHTFDLDTDYLIEVVYSATEFKLYVDGVLEISVSDELVVTDIVDYGATASTGTTTSAYYLDTFQVADAPFTAAGVAFRLAVN